MGGISLCAPNAALTRVLPCGQVPLRPDIFTWLEKRKTSTIHSSLWKKLIKGQDSTHGPGVSAPLLQILFSLVDSLSHDSSLIGRDKLTLKGTEEVFF